MTPIGHQEDRVAPKTGLSPETSSPEPMRTWRRFSSAHSTMPQTHLLSNGRYSVMLTAAGSGYSRWQDLALTRWRDDATGDDSGSYIYLRDVASGLCWSAGFQPSGQAPEQYEVTFAEGDAEVVRRDDAIATRLAVVVSPVDDAEIRLVSLTNHDTQAREIEVTSYAEVVLAPAAADAAHPAFSNLFVQTERVPERAILLATRRRRAPEDTEIWLAHVVAVDGETIGTLEWETDRGQFLGRGRGVRDPLVQMDAHTLSGTVGAVLDPILSLRRRVRIPPGSTVHVAFSTLVAPSRRGVLDLADTYRDPAIFARVAAEAGGQAEGLLHELGISPEEARLFQTLGASILYGGRTLRASSEVLVRRTEGVAALWAHGISGDLPIVFVEVNEAEGLGLVPRLLRAQAFWRRKGLAVDLVILNARGASSAQDLQGQLETLVQSTRAAPSPEGPPLPGKVFILGTDQVTVEHRDVLEGVARVALSDRRGTLAAQIARASGVDSAPLASPRSRPTSANSLAAAAGSYPELEFYNGLGGFDAARREYVTMLRGDDWTPAPWINVIANAHFGCLVSEAGSGCTWSVNSQQNRLTAWSNDPVSDPPSDMFYVRDDDTGEVWSPTPLPIRESDGEYVVRHGHGYTRFEYDAHGLALEVLHFVPVDDPIKVSRLTLTNLSPHTRRLSVTAYLEWLLGGSRAGSVPFVITEMDAETGAMFARNSWNRDFESRIAFADLGGAQMAWTGDRAEFLGRHGTLDHPAALDGREKLSGSSGAGFDPCCALQTTVKIPAGGQVSVLHLLGQTDTREQARALIQRYRVEDLEAQLKAVTDGWARVSDTLQVTTPDRALDLLLNQRLLYQTLACRLWARSAFYQSSGAYGFRDQLQDVLALTVARPDLARAHILKAAARQFVEGDVQHWWHEPSGLGVRTRISDDLLWLPYVASHYLDVTGDPAALDEVVPFLDGPVLPPGELESVFEPRVAVERGTLYEHCARALDRSLRVGTHGLPLMGTGDWNDGMNRVGAQGSGESVWLAWFLHTILMTWVPLAAARGETKRAETWARHAGALREAVERDAWDGRWYRRAYFDDGTPLGTAGSEACAIDAIAQSWSVMSGAANSDRARRAMASVDEHLVRRDDRVVLLLTPPFDQAALEPGYIKGYVPGVRENGGQYTHAAAWTVIAFAALGDGDKAATLLALLNPITHTATPQGVQRYRGEPYVVAGDVYSEAPHAGRGGWSWYTGAAGWLYRAGVEWILGIRVRGTHLVIDPCIPSDWPGFTARLTYRSAHYDIEVENPSGVCRGVTVLELDDAALDTSTGVPLLDDHQHHRVRVVLGSETPAATAKRRPT